MTQRVPSWDLKEVNPNHHIFNLDYEVAELTWENGQVALHELGSCRVPTKSQPKTSWDQPRAAETLEALVNQATLQQPYYKTDVAVKDVDELVPWMHHHKPPVDVGNLNESITVTSDALVPNSNPQTADGSAQAQPSVKSVRDAGCSTHVSSCSGNPSVFMDPRMARDGGKFLTRDVYERDVGGRRLTSTSTGSPENTSSGRDCSNSTFPEDTACHRRTQKRRDKINQKLKTLQKLVPNSSKTDKASILDEVIEHIKQLQVQVNTANMMNMSPMMMSMVIQQQLQLQKSMMNSMGMGMGGMDMNANIPPRFHPSAFMHMPLWNNTTNDQLNANTMAGNPMPAFLASRSQPQNMDSYSRMAALYQQQMQNQPCGPFPKN